MGKDNASKKTQLSVEARRALAKVRPYPPMSIRVRTKVLSPNEADPAAMKADDRAPARVGGLIAADEAKEQAADEARRRVQHECSRSAYQEGLKKNYIKWATRRSYGENASKLGSAELHQLQTEYVSRWFEDRKESFRKPNQGQSTAIARMAPSLLVRARAGSGKTEFLAQRVAFLVKGCGVEPGSILLLTLNKPAAAELEERIVRHLGMTWESFSDSDAARVPHVHTFDSLAGGMTGSAGMEDKEFGDIIREIMLDFIKTQQSAVRAGMMRYFRLEWESIQAGVFTDRDTTLTSRRQWHEAGEALSLGNNRVKSPYELRIANFLFEHNIPYEYERKWSSKGKHISPDFTIWPKSNEPIVVEFLGFTGDPQYDAKTEFKHAFWEGYDQRPKPKLVWLNHAEMEGDRYQVVIIDLLERRGTSVKRLTEDEIWEKIKEFALGEFEKIAKSVVGKARLLNWSGADLSRAAKGHDVEDVLCLCSAILDGVDNVEDKRGGSRDFARIMWDAVARLGSAPAGRFPKVDSKMRRKDGPRRPLDLSGLTEILLDEAQDFSPRFKSLIEGLKRHSPSARVVSVGDDWQAINRFAGADVALFEELARTGEEVRLSLNLRSRKNVVATGNRLMARHGFPAQHDKAKDADGPGRVILLNSEAFVPTPVEVESIGASYFIDKTLIAMLARIAGPSVIADKKVVLLARSWLDFYPRRGDVKKKGPMLDAISEAITGKKGAPWLDASTVHAFKGGESEVVILLANRFPLLHPHRVFTSVFGESDEILLDDERRLFYVGLSRAVSELVIVANGSPKGTRLWQDLGLRFAPWTDHPEWTQVTSAQGWLEISVSNGFDVKDRLKEAGYRFDGNRDKSWCKAIRLAAGSLERAIHDSICEPWVEHAGFLRDDTVISVFAAGKKVACFSVINGIASPRP